MLELATLGLVGRESLHGYRLTRLLALLMGSCISVDYGAIYPLSRRLEQRGYISSLSIQKGEAGARRVSDQITPQEQARWFELMLERHRESWVNSRARFLVMWCFVGDWTPKQRWEQGQARLTHVQAEATQGLLADRYQQAVRLVQEELAWVQELLQGELTQKQAAVQVQG